MIWILMKYQRVTTALIFKEYLFYDLERGKKKD